jgi:BirA family transcriptional regulator, biotin operon repressor / biotin---[acetyl-CoA-carboxylase] ligase
MAFMIEPKPFQRITKLPFIDNFYHFPSIDSTNTFAKSISDLSIDKMIVIVADRQTGGRGQKGNRFFSDNPGGIWCTIIQRVADISAHFTYNRALSLAISDSIAYLSDNQSPEKNLKEKVTIKWPNDIYWGDKKICGILLESHPASQLHIIIGFGLNVTMNTIDFPQELRETATSLLIETGKSIDIPELLETILRKFAALSDKNITENHAEYLHRIYRPGSRVEINGNSGIFKTVREDGMALLDINGKEVSFSSGPMLFR